jgi:Xaa-Pro aminopeptidase
MKTIDFLISSSSPDIRHRTGLTASDEFLYIRQNGQDTVWFDSRELKIQEENLKKNNRNITVKPLEPYVKKAQTSIFQGSRMERVVYEILQELNITSVQISLELPYRWVQMLQRANVKYETHNFANERLYKNKAEIKHLKAAQLITNGAFDLLYSILKEATIDGGFIMYQNEILTSEYAQKRIKKYFLDHGYSCPHDIIIASGEQSACPHESGSGPLYAGQCIVVDMFPQCDATGYHADMTRTWVKGTPTQEAQQLFNDVKTAQLLALKSIEIGKECQIVHNICTKYFTDQGYKTTQDEGFTHGIGHGLGLEIHEAPTLSKTITTLIEPGMVFTIEPGLYYKDIGGVRIEDVVVIHKDGTIENINTYPKDFIIP